MVIANNVASLTPKKVSELGSSFFIPDYQRGYRWGRHNVRQLLNDIRDSKGVYYLQPVVVCPHNHRDEDSKEYNYDVIDGQQRLTTLLIIYKGLESIYNMMESNPLGFNILSIDLVKCAFTLSYQTRNDSEDFLNSIKDKSIDEAREFADFLYMYHAYQEVYSWFTENKSDIAHIAKSLKEQVFLIWYEVNADEDKARQIFENLNIGKIRLTNAELVKAIFLSQTNSRISDEEQNVIAQQWDEIERRLHDKVLWSFLTKKSEEQYATRIELLFDMVAEKKDKERDEFFTFLYFDKLLKGKNQKEEWEKIYIQYLKLLDWFNDNEYYHKIGYLVSVGPPETLQKLYAESMDGEMTNSSFKASLNQKIKDTLSFRKMRIEHLSYNEDYSDVTKLLTLFNVITTYNLNDETQKYPFYLHNTVKGGWSIEHIHAQQSEPINDIEPRKNWINLHYTSLQRYLSVRKAEDASKEEIAKIEALSARMHDYLENKNIQTQNNFNSISKIYSEVVVSKLDVEYKDLLGNLALLGKDDNSVLNNSTFDVKREIITKELTAISYIPICTQHVFLKKYTPSDRNDMFFWGDDDRAEYVKEIKTVLGNYLPQIDELVHSLFMNVSPEIDKTWGVLEQVAKNKKESLTEILNRHANDKMFKEDTLAYYEALKERSIEESTDSLLLDELKSIISKIENYG
jgi:uncharacterized protein with ParB-like and HNH nuclease domain